MSLSTFASYFTFLSSSSSTTPEAASPRQQFDAYWNVPSFMCHKYGVKFEDLKDFGIRQNAMDKFRGEEIAILYDPGMFPALLTDKNGKPRKPSRSSGWNRFFKGRPLKDISLKVSFRLIRINNCSKR